MTVNAFQIVFVLFVLGVTALVFRRRKAGELSARAAVFWTLLWVASAGVVLWPEGTSIIAHTLGIGRGTDVVLYSAVAVLFFLLFRLHIKIESLNRDITKVVREKAFKQVEKDS